MNWKVSQIELGISGLKLPKEMVRVLELPGWDEIHSIHQALPGLKPLMLRPGLQRILRNFKILDWVSKAMEKNQPDSANLIGESDLIDWIWNSWVQAGEERHAKAGLLQKIGTEEVRTFTGGISLSELSVSEQLVLTVLEESQLLSVKNSRVNFTHDLLGDWSRLQFFIGLDKAELVAGLRSRAENPRWHQAIRLFGLRTLEREIDSSSWYQLHQQLKDGSEPGTVAADLLLDAAAFSTNASLLLERAWTHLSVNDGVLLQRLIRRFRHGASFPDPRVLGITPDDDLRLLLSSSMRIPYWPYWGPMLTFLLSHADDVKRLAIDSASELCQLWLSQMPTEISTGKPFPWRRKAAELSLLIAREVQGLKAEGVRFRSDTDKSPYEAFLYGAPDYLEQVSTLALELAQRRPPATEIQKRAAKSIRQRSEEHERKLKEDPEYFKHHERISKFSSTPSFLGRRLDPWPDGPTDMIDDAFRKACIEKGALRFLMQHSPEVAKEVILALCIEPPMHEYEHDEFHHMQYGTAWGREGAIFFHGPFLLFLRTTPITAIELIVELVNRATERWRDWARAPNGIGSGSNINEDQTVDLWIKDKKHMWLGDCRVFGWYRNSLTDAEYVVSALMALEKWLYDEVDAGRNVSEWVQKIINEANSTAFAGVLVALAKRHPELLLNCLSPILSIWQIFKWDLVTMQNDYAGMSLFAWARKGEEGFNMVRDWHFMPHRKIVLRDQVVQLMLSKQEFQIHLAEIREKWLGVLNHTEANEDLELTIEHFNLDNYKWVKDEAGNKLLMLEWPEHLKDRTQAALESISYSMNLISFPFHCREILNRNEPLDFEKLEQHWKTLRHFVDEFEEQEQEVKSLDNAVMAGIAVLIVLHSDWLQSDQEKEEWCINQIQRIITVTNVRDALDTPRSISDTNWESFFGEIAVSLLAENASDKHTRELLFQSICAFHYKTTELVCKAAYKMREKLGVEFRRILNLCRLWAGIRWTSGSCERLNIQNVKLQEWDDSVLKSFVDGTLPTNPIPLDEIVTKSEDIIREAESQHSAEHSMEPFATPNMRSSPQHEQVEKVPSRSHLGLDWDVIQAAHAWIPALDHAIDEEERKRWIAIHRELLDLELIYLRTTGRGRHGKIEGTPYKFERWIFDLIARLIPKLKPEERPEEFWQPILDFGAVAHYWVDDFLSSLFIEGTRVASSPQVFVSHWRPMIQYALNSPLWRNDYSVPCHYRLEDLYIQLMGLRFGTDVVGHQDYSDTISGLLPLYKQWAAEWLNQASVAGAFANFLLKPSASKMMLPGLVWLSQSIKQIQPYRWDTYSLSSSIMSLLLTCWRKHPQEIEAKPEVRTAFLSILNLLISKNYAGALELRDQIVQSTISQSD